MCRIFIVGEINYYTSEHNPANIDSFTGAILYSQRYIQKFKINIYNWSQSIVGEMAYNAFGCIVRIGAAIAVVVVMVGTMTANMKHQGVVVVVAAVLKKQMGTEMS